MRDAGGRQVGTVTFAETAQGRVRISANFNFSASTTQPREGFHGFHIHANNNPANGSGCIADPTQPAATHFVSVDGHYNGGTHNAHAGDMPSPFFLNDGVAVMSFERRLDINDIAGRGVILHTGIDNFNNIPLGPNPDQYTANSQAAIDLTAATGNAGPRQACGIIQ
jgi:Cu/Zn superoxide dismutase